MANAPLGGDWVIRSIWTGSELIVYGGSDWWERNDGGRYNPASNSWIAMGFSNPPAQRMDHSAAWTGTEMLIWGGNDAYGSADTCWGGYNNGMRFSPANDAWTPMLNAPIAGRAEHSTIWTGDEMIVWGGWRDWCSYIYLADGARYSPATNTWLTLAPSSLLARAQHSAVWTGSQMIVWGGFRGGYLADGAAWNVTNDTWQTLPALNAPTTRRYHSAVWTGDDMIVWGGFNGTYHNNGARYSPSAGMWYPLPATDAPVGRYWHTAVWTGTDMIVWGGYAVGGVRSGDGARYNPIDNQWYAIPATLPNSPTARWKHSAVWTGNHMIVWAGDDNATTYVTDTGALFDPLTDTWTPMTTFRAPLARHRHSAVWTGREMIVFGGAIDLSETKTSTGGKYYPY